MHQKVTLHFTSLVCGSMEKSPHCLQGIGGHIEAAETAFLLSRKPFCIIGYAFTITFCYIWNSHLIVLVSFVHTECDLLAEEEWIISWVGSKVPGFKWDPSDRPKAKLLRSRQPGGQRLVWGSKVFKDVFVHHKSWLFMSGL